MSKYGPQQTQMPHFDDRHAVSSRVSFKLWSWWVALAWCCARDLVDSCRLQHALVVVNKSVGSKRCCFG